jgi:hypothetical protein
MSQYHSNPSQPPAMTPPVHGGEMPAQPTSWPTVLGVILIIMASLGLLSNVCGGVFSVFAPQIMSAMPAEAADDPTFKAQMDVTRRFMPFQLANAAILLALGVLLLMAGIGLARRRRASIKYARLWATGRILWAIPAAVATHYIMVESLKMMEQAAADSGQPMPAGIMGFMQMLGPVGAVINLVFWCAMPVFVLIWFARAKIKNEVATWV